MPSTPIEAEWTCAVEGLATVSTAASPTMASQVLLRILSPFLDDTRPEQDIPRLSGPRLGERKLKGSQNAYLKDS